MNVAHRVRLAQIENVVIALEIATMVAKARAAESGLVETQVLNHRAHRAVKHENALARGLRERRANRAAIGDA